LGCRRHREPPDDDDRRFWLERFDDHEVLALAEGFYGRGTSLP
jgi:hypothetical protein